MRISPYLLDAITRQMLAWEVKGTEKPINFLFHPSEAVAELPEESIALHRSDSMIGHLFSDIIRTKIKLKNLNDNALTLLEKELQFWSRRQQFMQIKDAKLE